MQDKLEPVHTPASDRIRAVLMVLGETDVLVERGFSFPVPTLVRDWAALVRAPYLSPPDAAPAGPTIPVDLAELDGKTLVVGEVAAEPWAPPQFVIHGAFFGFSGSWRAGRALYHRAMSLRDLETAADFLVRRRQVPAPGAASADDLRVLARAVRYLESANRIIEEMGEDEEDIRDAAEVAAEAKAVLQRLGSPVPSEAEFVEGAGEAVRRAIAETHEAGLPTVHERNGMLVRVHPDGRVEEIGPLGRGC